jgi:hypothetical protein
LVLADGRRTGKGGGGGGDEGFDRINVGGNGELFGAAEAAEMVKVGRSSARRRDMIYSPLRLKTYEEQLSGQSR